MTTLKDIDQKLEATYSKIEAKLDEALPALEESLTATLTEHIELLARARARYEDNKILHLYGAAHAGPCPVCEAQIREKL